MRSVIKFLVLVSGVFSGSKEVAADPGGLRAPGDLYCGSSVTYTKGTQFNIHENTLPPPFVEIVDHRLTPSGNYSFFRARWDQNSLLGNYTGDCNYVQEGGTAAIGYRAHGLVTSSTVPNLWQPATYAPPPHAYSNCINAPDEAVLCPFKLKP